MIRQIKNEHGMALAVSLLVVVVLLILGSIFILRTIIEKNLAERGRLAVQAFYIAEGGAHEALEKLDTLINTDMMNTINDTNPQTVANKAKQHTDADQGLEFAMEMIQVSGATQFVPDGLDAVYQGPLTNFGGGTYQYKIILTEKSDPVEVASDMWEFPYYYRIETTGTMSGVIRKILLNGDFTVRVQRDNFAKFALFTDHHQLESGTPVWFTDKTSFAGPLHTNDRYSFALNPSGTFEDTVTQHLTTARFYNQGSPILADADSNPPRDVPTFNNGYVRGDPEIVLASSVQKQDLIDQATGDENIVGDGIFVPSDGGSLIGGIFVRGDATISMGVDVNDDAFYSITQGGTTKIITVDRDSDQTSVETVGLGTNTYSGIPDGIEDLGTIIYVDGEIISVAGTVQRDTNLTLSSENDIVVTDHLMYSDYTPAVGDPGDIGYVPPNAVGKTNLLGLVSWGGDVRVGTAAPNDLNIHGTIMARNGVFAVDNYYDTGVGGRGTVTLLGGAITQFYGAFGQFNGNTGEMISGYGRNFNYDARMSAGASPPYFPSMKTFVAFTNDLTDKVAWQEGGF